MLGSVSKAWWLPWRSYSQWESGKKMYPCASPSCWQVHRYLWQVLCCNWRTCAFCWWTFSMPVGPTPWMLCTIANHARSAVVTYQHYISATQWQREPAPRFAAGCVSSTGRLTFHCDCWTFLLVTELRQRREANIVHTKKSNLCHAVPLVHWNRQTPWKGTWNFIFYLSSVERCT